MAFIDINPVQSWRFDPVLNGINRIEEITDIKWIRNTLTTPFNYKQDRNYQFVTSVTGSGVVGQMTLRFTPPFSTNTAHTNEFVSSDHGMEFYTYNNPETNGDSPNVISYGAYESFTSSAITSVRMHELKFLVNGFAEYRKNNISIDFQPSGWVYKLAPNGVDYTYEWLLSNNTTSLSPSYSIIGSGMGNIMEKNYLARLIEYDMFNLELKYEKVNGNVTDALNIYLVNAQDFPFRNRWQSGFVTTLTQSTTLVDDTALIGLRGVNVDGTRNYLVITYDGLELPGISRATTFHGVLSHINVYGSYHPLNNRITNITDSESPTVLTEMGINIDSATYSYTSMRNGSTYSIFTKVGNGFFKAGIWENGVWNNGWRKDSEVRDFDDVSLAVLTESDVSWKIEIRGSTQSIANFATGSVVSIGNIVAIDINDNRKLLKDYYRIESIGINGNYGWFRVNLDTPFPYRRIEKDSPNHKIKVTKNIWLSGGFFNGFFSGVWNYGLFRGYPLLTEAFDTHWIDGFFNGGRFNSNYSYNWEFVALGPREACSNGFIDLTFNSKTTFLSGDYINVSLRPEFLSATSSAFANNYTGVTRIMNIQTINDGERIYDVVTIDKTSIGLPMLGSTASVDMIGSAQRHTATSLVQNFKFYDNNRSSLKASDTPISSAVFSYNSWIDVNYDNTRSVTLGRGFRTFEPLTRKSINRNNLFGYPTYDVLSSASRFRDSDTLNSKLYSLGTKYKVFKDFVGENSEFNEPFDPLLENISNFYNAGWTFSYRDTNIYYNRTENLVAASDSLEAQEYINSGVTGDELYVISNKSGGILNNDSVEMVKNRYSVVEFDLITYSVTNPEYSYRNESYTISESGANAPTTVPFTQSISSSTLNTTVNRIMDIDPTLVEGGTFFGSGFNGVVHHVVPLSDGSLVVTGSFSSFNGVGTVVDNVCKILPDGVTIDETFPGTNAYTMFNNAGYIKPLAIDSVTMLEDRVIFLVNYTTPISMHGKSIRSRLVRLNVTGNLDISWVNQGMGFNGKIYDIDLRRIGSSDAGMTVVVGEFSKFWYYDSNDEVVMEYNVNKMASFMSNGAFNSVSLYTLGTENTQGFDANDVATAVAFAPNGEVLVGGKITRFRQANSTYYINGIVRLTYISGKFRIVPSFVASNSLSPTTKGFQSSTPIPALPSGAPNYINKIYVDNDNNIYVGGMFNAYVNTAPYSAFNFIRLTSTGLVDTNFTTGQGFSDTVYDFHVASDRVYVSGAFEQYNNVNVGKIVALRKSNASLLYASSNMTPIDSTVRTFLVRDTDIILGGDFIQYNQGQQSLTPQTILTSTYIESNFINPEDILNISVNITLSCEDVSKLSINLKSPDERVINLKKHGVGNGTMMIDTTFDISSEEMFSNGVSPYSATFRMDRLLSVGSTGYVSDVTDVEGLVETNTSGSWVLYILDQGNGTINVSKWYMVIRFKNYIEGMDEESQNITLPIIHFSNLNYEITTQTTLNGTSSNILQIYKKMNYLPINQNVNHLLTKNTFRLDSVENATPDKWGGFGEMTKYKKYEYFYNKTDMMMNISGNGYGGASQSQVVIDNLNMYEVDMIPFFKYFNESNIYKGIQEPIRGTSPEIDYMNSDFVFVDNISIGLDTIETQVVNTDFIGCSSITLDDVVTRVNITDIILSHTFSSYQYVNAITENDPGSATCSTVFDSIVWSIYPNAGWSYQDTLYPRIHNLNSNTNYTVSVTVTNGAQSSTSQAVIYVEPQPEPQPVVVTSNSILNKAINFTPNDTNDETRGKVIAYSSLVQGYYHSEAQPPRRIKLYALPNRGDLVYNNVVMVVGNIVNVLGGSAVANFANAIITGLKYYPENYIHSAYNQSFFTTMSYTVMDEYGNESNMITLNLMCNAPASVVTIPSPKELYYEYASAPVFNNLELNSAFLTGGYSSTYNAQSITVLTLPDRGSIIKDGVPVSIGQTFLLTDLGNFIYKPNGFTNTSPSGTFDTTFRYKITDTSGADSNNVDVTIHCIWVG